MVLPLIHLEADTASSNCRRTRPLPVQADVQGMATVSDFAKDWKRWTKGERAAFHLVVAGMLVATACLALYADQAADFLATYLVL